VKYLYISQSGQKLANLAALEGGEALAAEGGAEVERVGGSGQQRNQAFRTVPAPKVTTQENARQQDKQN